MKTILLLITATIFSINLFAQNFLVPIKGDTVFFDTDFEVNHKESAKWKKITINGTTYPVNKIQSLQSANVFYFNIDKRHLWKRVVTGKINVFALIDKDTIADKARYVHKNLFIQKNQTNKYLKLTNNNLMLLSRDNATIYENIKQREDLNEIGKTVGIPSAFATGLSGVALLYTGFTSFLNPNKTLNNGYVYKISIAGIIVGTSGTIIGSLISSNSKKMSLDPIYYYNQK